MSEEKTGVSLTFKIYRGEELIRTERLAQDVIKVGKLPSSHLRIDDENVSRMHAVVEITSPDEIYIIDLGSSSGTVVNGRKVNKSKIQSGDEIVLGETRIIVEVGEATDEEQSSYAAAASQFQDATKPEVELPEAREQPMMMAPPSASSPPIPGIPRSAPPLPFMGGGSHEEAEEDPEKVQYTLVASGPPVTSDEVETADSAIEVMVMWGDRSVLHVQHLSPPRNFYIGESAGKDMDVDYIVGSESLGTDRMPIVLSSGGAANVVVPSGATATLTSGQHTDTMDALERKGALVPSAELGGARQIALPPGGSARVQYRGFTFLVKSVQAGRPIGAGVKVDPRPYAYVGGSLLVNGLLLLTMYFMPPSSASLSLDLLNADSRLVKYMTEAEALEEEKPEFMKESGEKEGGTGERHKDDEGQMGKEDSKKTQNRFGIKGPADNPDPHMAREQAKEQARTAGVLGLLASVQGAWDSPTSPYGQDTALGNDPMSAMGALMGSQIGDNFGFGGLGLRGTGRGGGGTGEGTIGLGNLGKIGHGAGTGEGSGYGSGVGGIRGRESKVPSIRSGPTTVRGSLSKDVIRRIIRRHLNEVRFCYEQELGQRPDLEGRVTVSFIISPTGAVQSSTVGESTLGNQRAESCITTAVRRWTFPSPEGGGIVIVNYPFMLSPAGG